MAEEALRASKVYIYIYVGRGTCGGELTVLSSGGSFASLQGICNEGDVWGGIDYAVKRRKL